MINIIDLLEWVNVNLREIPVPLQDQDSYLLLTELSSNPWENNMSKYKRKIDLKNLKPSDFKSGCTNVPVGSQVSHAVLRVSAKVPSASTLTDIANEIETVTNNIESTILFIDSILFGNGEATQEKEYERSLQSQLSTQLRRLTELDTRLTKIQVNIKGAALPELKGHV